MKSLTNKKEIIIFALSGILLVLLCSYLYTFTLPARAELYLTPVIDDPMGWEIYTMDEGSEAPLTTGELMEHEGTAYLRREISPQWFEYGYDRVRISADQWISVFVDGSLVFTNCLTAEPTANIVFPITENIDWNQSPGFSLDSSWAGKTLTIATAAKDGGGKMPAFVLTSNEIADTISSAWANSISIPATIFGLLGFLLLLLFAYGKVQKQSSSGLLILAVAAFMQMFVYLSQFSEASLTFLLRPLFIRGFLLLPMLYLALQMKKQRRVFLPLLLCCFAFSFALEVLQICAVYPPVWLLNAAQYTLLLPFAALFWCGFKEKKDGNAAFSKLMPWLVYTFAGVAILFLLSLPLRFFMPQSNTLLDFIRYLAVSATQLFNPIELIHFMTALLLFLLFLTAALEQIRHSVQAAEEIKLLTLKNDLSLENLHTIEHSVEALATARHDALHHLRILAKICEESPQKAAEYANSLAAGISGIPTLHFTENRLINTILTVQASKAEQNGVHFNAEAILPEKINISEKDLCSVLMNLLENAINAAAQSIADKIVSVRLSIEDGYFLVAISNTLPQNFILSNFQEKLGLKTFLKAENHGIGLRSVRAIVANYGGELRFSVNGDKFLVQTAMRISRYT